MAIITIILGEREDVWAEALMAPYENMTILQRELARTSVFHWDGGFEVFSNHNKAENSALYAEVVTYNKFRAEEGQTRWPLIYAVRVPRKEVDSDMLEVLTALAAEGHHVEVLRVHKERIAA